MGGGISKDPVRHIQELGWLLDISGHSFQQFLGGRVPRLLSSTSLTLPIVLSTPGAMLSPLDAILSGAVHTPPHTICRAA